MDGKPEMSINEYLPLRDGVFQKLRQDILRGEMKPGERLMEVQLANKLGVSRTPIREAIRKLELEGLVTMVPRKGAEVAQITEKNLKDVLEVRRSLEELAVKLACERITYSQLEQLKAAAREFEEILSESDVTEIAEADVRFHDIIYMAADNQRLLPILNNLQEQMYRFRVEYLKNKKFHLRLVKEHGEIIEALEFRNKELAIKRTIEHIDNQELVVVHTLTCEE